MAHEVTPMNVSDDPQLLRLAEEVQRTKQPRLLQRDGKDLAVVSPAGEQPTKKRMRGGTPTSADDPLWAIVGIARSDGPGDVSEHKHRYLADAYASTKA